MSDERSVSTYLLAGVAAVIVIVGAMVFVVRRPEPSPSRPQQELTAEQKNYLAQIAVSETKMSAARNFLGDTVTYLDAKVTNKGSRLVRQLDLRLEFVDTLNQVVLRETARPITPRTPPLKPGETRAFQVTFEHMPTDWNQAAPAVTPTFISF